MSRRAMIFLALAALAAVLAILLVVIDARETARLGACMQRGIDRYAAEGTYPTLPDGRQVNLVVAGVCDEDPGTYSD